MNRNAQFILVAVLAAVIGVASVVALEFGHTATLDTPEMLADLPGLVLSKASVHNLGEQGAVGALGNAITFYHVGVERLALWVVVAVPMAFVVSVRGFCVIGADVAWLD